LIRTRFADLDVKVGASCKFLLAADLRRATPHRMRHTHAFHALQGGAELTTVRDNLHHASIATTLIYLYVRRRQTGAADRGCVCQADAVTGLVPGNLQGFMHAVGNF
jgi:integrase